MRSKLKHWLANLALAFGSLAAVLAFLEFVVFGTLLKPDDVLANVTFDGVVRYAPKSTAVFRHPDGRESKITINAQGWNSSKPSYERARQPGRLRVAVIGDSYVNASYVDTADAFPEVMERRLQARGIDTEVLRFGMDGAPLSQYLNVLRREVMDYAPDVVLVQLIHNDFDESYRQLSTRYASSFLKIDVDEDGKVTEVPPADFQSGTADVLRNSATFRYLYYETNLYLTLRSFVSRYFWGGDEHYDPAHIVSAVDVRRLDDPERMARVTRHIVAEMQALARKGNFKLALSIDAVRETIYGRNDASTRKLEQPNRIAADAARLAGVPLMDLTRLLADDYAARKEAFEYDYDWHWNARANRLIGDALADWISEAPRLMGGAQPAPAPSGAAATRRS